MFTLTESARTELDAFFADKEKSAIRLYLAPGGCSGPRIGLALDEPNEQDFVAEQDGYTFCATKELWATIGGATVDASPMGFLVTPEIPLPNMGGGCGCSSCGTGTCGGGCHH
ncbi:IscA/HesB family protein [uncultured Mailhella sp.]|uniref:IscA/HesB family protein n=1 Tax=uncultured Mailhella sp. TaxID=1981031 RepID=UPI0025CFB88A|nr:IscA/HesB family protein [uncultured Mailhella sp.]